MSVGKSFDSLRNGTCGACDSPYKKGDRVQRWDDSLCHTDCVAAEAPDAEVDNPEASRVLVMRGADERPVAIPHDIVMQAERPYRAYTLHRAGYDWRMIALAEGYADWKAARADVKAYINEAGSLITEYTRAQMLDLELDRLLALQSANWDSAMAGNVSAGNLVLSTIITRAKFLHFDKLIVDNADQPAGSTGAVVIPSDEDGFTKGLELAAEG